MLTLLVAAALALLGPTLAPIDPVEIHVTEKMRLPDSSHLLGTDELGRDILSRLLTGAPLTLGLSGVAVAAGFAAGASVGVFAGYLRGRVDLVLLRLVDALMALPEFLLALTIVAILGPGLANTILAVALFMIPQFARLARALTLSVQSLPFIEAAQAVGCSTSRIITRHIAPNVLPSLIVFASLRAATAVLTISGLSFLGLGAQPPTPEWGAMIASGRDFIFVAPHLILFPGLAVMAVVFGLNMLGDGLRDTLDPRLRAGGIGRI
jgi:peptide/nickel transport system permease protein